jgi:hypothetical protein
MSQLDESPASCVSVKRTGTAAGASLRCVSWTVADCQRLAAEMLCRTGDRWLHVERVATTVHELAVPGSVASNVLPAAWLHDIGYAPDLVHTGMHAIDGALFLDRVGAPVEVVSLVAFHTGAEFEAEERGLIDTLAQFDRPVQEELDLLILADLLSGSSGERVTLAERFDGIFGRYEPQHPVHRAVTRSRPYLEESARRAADRVGYPI